MSLQNTISNDLKKAMIAKEKDKLDALRAVKADLIVEMAKDGSDSVPDDISEKIISKLVKQRKESASIFSEQGRDDLAKDEIIQLEYLEVYLPEKMGEEEVCTQVTRQSLTAQTGNRLCRKCRYEFCSKECEAAVPI